MIWKYVREQKPRVTNRRRHRRHRADRVRAEIDKQPSYVIDISESGIRIAGAPNWVVKGQGLSLSIIFPTLMKDIRIPIFGRVLRRGDDGMILVYPHPIDRWPESLETLVRETA